jgi:hypothetical protein
MILQPRFDWYAGSVSMTGAMIEESGQLVGGLKKLMLDRFGGEFEAAPPMFSYEQAMVHQPTRARLMWGGVNPRPYLAGTGGDAPQIATFLRDLAKANQEQWHTVSRADVCLDFDAPGSFEKLTAIVEPIAREARCAVQFMGDPSPDALTGRTWYFGSPQSDTRVVIYEKGRKEIAEGAEGVPEHWTRLELRVRPRKERRHLCASLPPAEFFGLSRWTMKIAEEVGGSLVPFVPDESLRRSSEEKAMDHVVRQYGRVFEHYRQLGGNELLMQEIIKRLDLAQDELRREASRSRTRR